jgi:hypothetical protein
MADINSAMIGQLLDLFCAEEFEILGAKNRTDFPPPKRIDNDGYGDQQPRRPDIIAFDKREEVFVLGIVKTPEDDLESSSALTDYDVLFDHKNPANGKPSRIFAILPPERVAEFSSLITHYIHPDYWKNLTIVQAKDPDLL